METPTFKEEVEKAKTGIEWVRGFDPQGFADLAVRTPDSDPPPDFRLPTDEIFVLVDAYRNFPLDILERFPLEDVRRIRDHATRMRQLLEEFVLQEDEKGEVDFLKVDSDLAQKIRVQSGIATRVMQAYTARAELMAQHAEGQALLAEIRQSRTAARTAAEESGVFQRASVFADEAKKHRRAAFVWGAGVLMIAFYFVVFVLAGSDVLFDAARKALTEGDEQSNLFRALADRFFVVAIVSFGLFFCTKNYMAHRHNEIVNRHRQNAVQVYLALGEAVKDDPQSKAIVLTQAARTIFGPQDSGYIRGGNSGGDEISVNARFPNTKAED